MCLIGVALAGALVTGQKLELEAHRDPGADFAALATYVWLPTPPIKSEIAPDAVTNPTLSHEVLGPHIVSFVDRELAARGLRRVEAGDADVQVVYYAALSVGMSTQELGSYYQYTTGWNLPASPTVASTTVERGSIVVDVVQPASKKAIWRGSVASRVNQENTLEKRVARLDEAIRRLFERFPRPKR
jgi:hypothetical protein